MYMRCMEELESSNREPNRSYDYKTSTISPDVAEQAEQAMSNISQALAEAGCTVADVVRVRYILPDRADFPKTW